MALRRHNSGTESIRELFKSSKDLASLLVCSEKKYFGFGFQIFVSDVISGGLLGHLGPLHLAMAQTVRSAMSKCGPVEGFMQPSLGFCHSKRILHTSCPCFNNLDLTFLLQVVLSATLSCLLPLQLGFKHFQDISFTKFSLLRSK